VFQPVHDVIDAFPEMRQREVRYLGDIVDVPLADVRERPLEIGEIFFSETNDPAAGVRGLVASPYIQRRYRLSENLSHRRTP